MKRMPLTTKRPRIMYLMFSCYLNSNAHFWLPRPIVLTCRYDEDAAIFFTCAVGSELKKI